MSRRLFLSIGEAMVELSQAQDDLWRLGFAGDTLNTAWYARARLDAGWRVSYLTRVGDDPFSHRLTNFLDENQIGTEFITRDPRRNIGLYSIELTDGERSFSYWRGQSAARCLADDEDALAQAMDAADVIYLSGITLAILPPERRAALLRLVGAARRSGKLTVFDPNVRPRLWEDSAATRDWMRRAAASAAIALPSFDDESALHGDPTVEACAARWRADGAGEVVVKNAGGAMAILHGDSDMGRITLEQVKPVDTTGAGDSFNGGYLAARLAGATPQAAVAAGHRLAALVIRRRGALVPMSELRAAAGRTGDGGA